jgi:hypothetical protein
MQRSYYGSDKTLVTELTLVGRFVFVPGIVFYNREHGDRSINLRDKKVLANWQDTSAPSKHHLSNLQRLGHLIEIAVRHRDAVSPVKTLGIIFLWALRPAQFGRCIAELIGLVSPSAQLWLLRTARRLVDLTKTGPIGKLQSHTKDVSSSTSD